jgi:hypothetical protein
MTLYYCLIWESSNLGDQVPTFISPRNRVAQLYPQPLSSLFVASYDARRDGGGILTRLHTGINVYSTVYIHVIHELKTRFVRLFPSNGRICPNISYISQRKLV